MPHSSRFRRLIDRLAQGRVAGFWAASASRAADLPLSDLRALARKARGTRRDIDRILRLADERSAAALGRRAGTRLPLHTDWVWRPDLWRVPVAPHGLAGFGSPAAFGAGTTVFHDCPLREISLRQERNTGDRAVAPFALRIEVLGFSGSFLSLVIDLPDEALRGLGQSHVIRVDAAIALDRSIPVFGRLNVRHGPNTEQIVRQFDPGADPCAVEFDLGYSRLNEKRVEKAWLDVIFEGPGYNRVTLSDLTLCRHPRAAI